MSWDASGNALVPLAHLPEHLHPDECCMAAWEIKGAEEAEGAEHGTGFHPLSKPRASPVCRPLHPFPAAQTPHAAAAFACCSVTSFNRYFM